jgi:hypothetical protein
MNVLCCTRRLVLCCFLSRLDVPASASVVDASFAAGQCWLGLPGSVHQVYTAKGGEGCMLLMLYSKVGGAGVHLDPSMCCISLLNDTALAGEGCMLLMLYSKVNTQQSRYSTNRRSVPPRLLSSIIWLHGQSALLLLLPPLTCQDCTFIRAASPLISRQLLPSTAEKGAQCPTLASNISIGAYKHTTSTQLRHRRLLSHLLSTSDPHAGSVS